MEDQENNNKSSSWMTPVIREDGKDPDPVGATFFLTDEDLIQLGVELDGQQRLRYRIKGDGMVEVFSTE